MEKLEAVKGIKQNFIPMDIEVLPIHAEYQERGTQALTFYEMSHRFVAKFMCNSPYL